jgi:hypothetical protein
MVKAIPVRKPFLDGDRIKELLEATSAGLTFLRYTLTNNSLDPDERESIALCVTSPLQGMVEDAQELIGDNPAVLNQVHPRFENFCRDILATEKSSELDRPKPDKEPTWVQ